jgi:L-rhamnose mutarotase
MSERVAILQRLDPTQVDEYVEAHEEVPEAVSSAMKQGGVEEYELFVTGNIAVGVVTVNDFDTFVEQYRDDPQTQEWEARVDQFKLSGVDPETMEMPTMERIWRLSDEA